MFKIITLFLLSLIVISCKPTHKKISHIIIEDKRTEVEWCVASEGSFYYRTLDGVKIESNCLTCICEEYIKELRDE